MTIRGTVIDRKKQSHTRYQSDKRPSSYCIEYQPQLVEETVLRAIVGHAEERIFRRERDAIYCLGDEEAREEAFQTLHQHWFEHIGLHEVIEGVFTHWPILKTHTHRCLLVKASGKKEIGAELFVAEDNSGQKENGIRSIVIQLTPELLIQSAPLLDFLRHELLHIIDMLDPEFGYNPSLPKSEIGPTYDRLLQERYRILWDLTIDGRLRRKNFLPASAEKKHWQIFKKTFSGPSNELKSIFALFFDNTAPRHQELVSFALTPENWFSRANLESEPKGICPLCHFPSYQLLEAKSLPSNVLHEISKEHTHWNPAQRICQQCADLYELRPPETGAFKEQ